MWLFPVWKKLDVWQRESKVSTPDPGVLSGATLQCHLGSCWILVCLHPSRAFLVPAASSCNRAVPNPLLAAWGSFSHRRFLLIDQLFFVFILFLPTGQWIHSLLSLLIFLDGQYSNLRKISHRALDPFRRSCWKLGAGLEVLVKIHPTTPPKPARGDPWHIRIWINLSTRKSSSLFPQKLVTIWWGRQGAMELIELQCRSGLFNSRCSFCLGPVTSAEVSVPARAVVVRGKTSWCFKPLNQLSVFHVSLKTWLALLLEMEHTV